MWACCKICNLTAGFLSGLKQEFSFSNNISSQVGLNFTTAFPTLALPPRFYCDNEAAYLAYAHQKIVKDVSQKLGERTQKNIYLDGSVSTACY